MFTNRSMIRYSPCGAARAVSARERLHPTFSTIIHAVMARKQLSLSEEELNILVDALNSQWWIRYDPKVENTVVTHHKLFQRILDAAMQCSKDR